MDSRGFVWNKKHTAPLKACDNGSGYLYVTFSHNGKTKSYRLHRLIAECFCEKKDVFCDYVNHIDGDKNNNDYKNLEWCDASYNISHAYNTGLRKPINKNYYDLYKDGVLFATDLSYKEVSDYVGFNSPVSVYHTNHTKNYYWVKRTKEFN